MLPSQTASGDVSVQQGPQSATQPHASSWNSQPREAANDSGFTMELLELELSVDGFSEGREGFTAYVTEAASALGGSFLFELPASGLVANCERIAVLRIPRDDAGEAMTIFACLETGGTTIRMENPSEETADLKNFADAFVDVLRRI
ncbi:hypothetical protein [Pararhizobium arenae]|uniref:hypothetical protein n=1 Tax=Pararhizobium arenae TaxID=1856850 RepID=UPI00094ABA36|nr:hypothetical protein [Pararhizobium arenae]